MLEVPTNLLNYGGKQTTYVMNHTKGNFTSGGLIQHDLRHKEYIKVTEKRKK
jgi:hypothetical protein